MLVSLATLALVVIVSACILLPRRFRADAAAAAEKAKNADHS
ncbi:hypothetical protein HD599_001955 [Conyzicola lurida]|uniref:Uncharacterized protein n=1 Tax=Conyzicola lurida TaxID=1172621 RepID=A0A841ANU9_9MICO|nr:hypothetical protein [Conyzicola lurida]MBB5843632.1 hypothetical protein [Conyzicola lurida]